MNNNNCINGNIHNILILNLIINDDNYRSIGNEYECALLLIKISINKQLNNSLNQFLKDSSLDFRQYLTAHISDDLTILDKLKLIHHEHPILLNNKNEHFDPEILENIKNSIPINVQDYKQTLSVLATLENNTKPKA